MLIRKRIAKCKQGRNKDFFAISVLLDRRADETPKSYAAYVALGARRSVREAARQYHIKTTSTGEISSVEDTTVRTWLGWSAKYKWVSRSLAREEWIASTSDEKVVANLTA